MPQALVVTLDAAVIQQVRAALEPRSITVIAAATGAGARDDVKARSISLAVVGIDVPDCDAFDLVTDLKADQPTLSVFLVGKDTDGRAADRAHASGAAAFIEAPVTSTRLVSAVEDRLGGDWLDAVGAGSLVEPSTGVFDTETGFDLSVTEEDGVAAESTQDLPSLAVEAFDEDNPVSIPVGADVTAHALKVLTSSGPALQKVKGPTELEATVTELLGPGGALHQTLRELVAELVAKELAGRSS